MREEAAPLADESRARKRQAIGLNPYRPTAKAKPVRPPGAESADSPLARWLPVLLLAGLVLVTLLLISARLFNSPMMWERLRLPAFGTSPQAGEQNATLLEDEFDTDAGLLAETETVDGWTFARKSATGLYEIRIQSRQMAWSTVGATNLPPHRLETQLIIADVTPAGQASVVGRFQDEQNFYWFAIDGQSRFQVQQRIAGELHMISPWLAHPAIQPAGKANQLALSDDDSALRFWVNDELLFELAQPALPRNSVGVGGAAAAGQFALIEVEWLRIQSVPNDKSTDD